LGGIRGDDWREVDANDDLLRGLLSGPVGKVMSGTVELGEDRSFE